MPNGHCFNRRDFLKSLGAAGAVCAAALTGGCENLLDQIRNRPIRRSIGTLSASDPIIQTFKDAVSAMKALPSSDPRSWTEQARIHLDHCPHGNWYFLPWHRAYLFYFEEICRELTGNDDFALPYWNWTVDRSIPAVFWGSGNPLFHSGRSATQSSQAASEFVGASVMESILDETNFFLFASGQVSGQRDFNTYGRLEQTPHNNIHGFVGGDMATFWSPLDPVFWTHHNMIDCCWVEWNVNRQNPNTNDTQWNNFTFSGNFVDRNGDPVDIAVKTTLLFPLFSYRYGPSQKGASELVLTELNQQDVERLRQFLEEGAAVELEMSERFALRQSLTCAIGEPASSAVEIRSQAVRSALEREDAQRLLVTVGGVKQPSTDDLFVRVFVGKPDASAQTPISDPHYAGSFAFFAHREEARHSHPPGDFVVDVTDTVRRLSQAGPLLERESLDIQLVAVPFPERETQVRQFTVQSLELGILPAAERQG